MSTSVMNSTCLICYKIIESRDIQFYAIYTCSECGQQYHYDHLKSWVIQNKNCPNCKINLFVDFGQLNTRGNYITCQDGFHMSEINRNRLTCIRCSQPLNSRFGIRSELKLNEKNELEYQESNKDKHGVIKRFGSLKELLTVRNLFMILLISFVITLFTIFMIVSVYMEEEGLDDKLFLIAYGSFAFGVTLIPIIQKHLGLVSKPGKKSRFEL